MEQLDNAAAAANSLEEIKLSPRHSINVHRPRTHHISPLYNVLIYSATSTSMSTGCSLDFNSISPEVYEDGARRYLWHPYSVLELPGVGGSTPVHVYTFAHFWVKIGFKFQFLCQISMLYSHIRELRCIRRYLDSKTASQICGLTRYIEGWLYIRDSLQSMHYRFVININAPQMTTRLHGGRILLRCG